MDRAQEKHEERSETLVAERDAIEERIEAEYLDGPDVELWAARSASRGADAFDLMRVA